MEEQTMEEQTMEEQTMEEQTMEVQTVEEQTTGCLVCGAPLEYLQSQIEMECTYCHKTFMSNARCVNGHFICDSCHEQHFGVKHVRKIPGAQKQYQLRSLLL